MKKLCLLIILCIVFFIYSNGAKAIVKEWTILVYFGADGHLEPIAIDDFNALEAGIDTTNYNVIVQMDRVSGYDNSNGDWTTCKRFLLKSDTLTDRVFRSTELADIGEVNMGSGQTLSNFITWGMQNYQSKRYAVVVWGSGTPMGICPDESSGSDPQNAMSGEITNALKQSTEAVQRRIDLFVAWGCNYGTFEHDFVVREYADVTARSQLATWNAEGSATDILEWLNLNPTATAQEFATAWVNAYTDYAISKGRCTGWAALDLNPNYVKLGTYLDAFSRELIKAGGRSQTDIAAAMTNTVYSYTVEFDLYHFAKNITNKPSLPQSLKDAAQDLIDAYGYSSPYARNPLLNFRFSEGLRATNEKWPVGDSMELRGCKIITKNYSDFEGNPAPFGCDTAYAPFKMNNAWKWFLADSTSLPNEVLLTYNSNSIGDSITSNGLPVSLNVTLGNSGGVSATSISAVLSSSDPFVTITQPNSAYNNITSEGTGISLSSFGINIDTSITNGHRIWFRLNITANGGAYTNTSTFCMETKKNIITNILSDTQNFDVSVYPNPTTGIFTISTKGFGNSTNISIINLQGQVVYKEQLNTTPNYTKQFDISNYPKGIYFLKLTGEDVVRVEKVIIQ